MSVECGILDWGVALPRRRLENQTTEEAWGRPAVAGSRCIAGHDEDAVTLAVQAALQAVRDDTSTPSAADAPPIDALILATTTAPFSEGSCAALIADVLNLHPDVRCLDMNTSRRSGAAALGVACDMVRARTARRVLVVAVDVRLAQPGGGDECLTGHGGAAVLIGPAAEGLADILHTAHRRATQADVWRTAESRFPRSADVRFARTGAYATSMQSVLKSVLQATGWSPEDVRRIAPDSPDAKSGAALLRKNSFDVQKQYCDRVSAHTGLTGTAHGLLLLIAALEQSAVGDRLIATNDGDGASALALRVRRDINRHRFDRSLSQGYTIRYNRYLSLHRLHTGSETADATFTSEMMAERDKRLWHGLVARRCLGCSSVLTLPLPTCPRCAKATDFADQRLQRRGTIFSVTHEHYVPTPEPPLGMAVVDLDGGGRLTVQIADENTPLTINDRVELVFRRLHAGGGRPNYFWKCRSLPSAEGVGE